MTVLSRRDLLNEADILGDELYQKARPRVVEHVRRMRGAADADGYNTAHRQLLIEYAARREAIESTVPAHRNRFMAELHRLRQERPIPVADIGVQQERLATVRRQVQVSRALRHTLRVITDGLVWRALDFERIAFAVLGRGVRVGALATGAGWDVEIVTQGYLLNTYHGVVVHNDLTTCLRHGDVTVIDLGDPPRHVRIAEVKATDGRVDWSQSTRLDDAIELLRTGYHPTANAGRPVRIHQVDADFLSQVDELMPLVTRAHTEFIAWAWLRPWLAVAVCDLRAGATDATRYSRNLDEFRVAARGRRVVSTSFMDRRVADRHTSYSWFMPQSLLPLPAEDVADVLMGYLEIKAFLDLDALAARLVDGGITPVFAEDPNAPTFFTTTVGGRHIAVPGVLRHQMLLEFMDPTSVIAAIKHIASVRSEDLRADESVMLSFKNEGRAWALPPSLPRAT
jgi:hypothetical protein